MKNYLFVVADVAALLTSPVLTSADQHNSNAAPSQPPIGPRSTLLDVDQLMITPEAEYEPAGGKPLSAAFIRKTSELAGVRITYVRTSDRTHLFQLPRVIYGPDAEALCQKVKQDVRIKWCTPNYMVVGQSAAAPNDPKYLSSEQWNLSNGTPAGINAKAAWTMTPGSSRTVIAIIDGGIIAHSDIAATRLGMPPSNKGDKT